MESGVVRQRGEAMEGRLTLSVEETAKLLGIGRNLCYDRVKTGEIPVIRVGRRLLVPRRALEKWLEEAKSLNPAPMPRGVDHQNIKEVARKNRGPRLGARGGEDNDPDREKSNEREAPIAPH